MSVAAPVRPRASLRDVRAERCRRSLRYFIDHAWEVVEPGTRFVPGPHIDLMCEHLEAVTRYLDTGAAGGDEVIGRLAINVPPRNMKSLTVNVFWPAWVWTHRPQTRFLCAANASTLSVRDALKTRRLMQSSWYQSWFGGSWAFTSDQNVKSRYDNSAGGYRIATSVGGAITGEGGDVLLVDDPHQADEALSDRIRQGVCEWYDQAWSTRKNDPKTTAEVLIMQRLHEDDLCGHVVRKGGWHHLCLPARFEPEHPHRSDDDWRAEAGELLWPERFGPAELDQLERDLGSYASAGQLQQRPAPAEGGLLKRAWFRTYKAFPHRATGSPLPADEWAISVDASFKDAASSSFVVMQVWARFGADCYLVDQVRGRMDFPKTIAEFGTLCARYPQVTLKLVEDKANGPAIISSLKSKIGGIVPVAVEGSKEARVAAISALVEAGNVYVPDPDSHPWVDGLLGECAGFPNASNDDQVDALSQMLDRWKTTRAAASSGPSFM